MRFSFALSLVLAFAVVAALGGAVGRAGARPKLSASPAVAAAVRDYRQLTWTYERIAHVHRTPSRGAVSGGAPQKVLARWQLRADLARRKALGALHRRLGVRLPAGPKPEAPAALRLAYNKRLTRMLERIFPAPARASRSLESARRSAPSLGDWQRRAAADALEIARHAPSPLLVRDTLTAALMCIHRYEGKWTSNTGNGYYGGLQMDLRFQHTYARAYLARWGTADHWPVWAQVAAARRAYRTGRGFTPWPNTRRACRL